MALYYIALLAGLEHLMKAKVAIIFKEWIVLSIIQAVILGIVQGLTEFLPVSSSGHLTIVQNIFGLEENMLAFNVLLHVGTLIPVAIVYWKEIFKLIKNPFQKMTALLIVGTLPAVVAALLFGDLLDTLFAGGVFLAFAYIITGILLMVCDKMPAGKKDEEDITFVDALTVGTIQAIAITPGISRSGSTITGSVACGMNKATASMFSFLLSIPAILGAVVLQLKDVVTGEADFGNIGMAAAVAGFLASMISGYLAIRFMLKLIKESKLKFFSYYVFALAVFILADHYILHFIF